MNRKKTNMLKAVVATAVALAFILPGSTAVVSIKTIEISPEMGSDVEKINSDIGTKVTEQKTESDNTDDSTAVKENEDPLSLERSIIYVDDDNTEGPWDGSWEHPYQYIQDGINNAANGDTIYVLNGMYYEKLTVNKQVDIIGQNRQNTIIDGGTSYGDTIQIIVDYVNISTFTVKNSYAYGSNTIAVGTSASKVSNIIITNCNVSNVGTSYGYGINVYYPLGPIDIINCMVYNAAYGIDVQTPANPTRIIDCSGHTTGIVIRLRYYYSSVAPFLIQNCTTYNNTGYGIYIDSMIDGDIIGCTSYNNGYSGIALTNSDYVNITDCITYNNTREGIKIGAGYNHPENVNITNCTSYNNEKGIYLYAIDCILTGNTMYDNDHNFVVEGFLNHQIDPTNTVNGKPIWYLVETNDLILDESYNIGFLGLISCNNITVKNAIPEGMVLSLTTNTTLYNITIHGRIYGVYISGGSNITLENFIASNITDTGFYIYYVENLTMINCHVPDFAAYNKNAFYVRGCPYASLINCSASNVGRNYGFNIYQSPYATLINCHAYNGGPTFATGIALYYSHYSTLTNCTVHDFQRGIDLRSNSQFVTLTDCTVYNITYCGFEARSSDCTFINCTVYKSEGFYFYNQPRNHLMNVKSYDNKYGAYFYYAAENTLVNCEFYNNTIHGIDIHSSSYSNTFTNSKSYNNGDHGVVIKDNSYGTILTDCQIYNNNYGIYITNTPNNIFTNTAIFNNTYNFDVIGGAATDFYQDIDTSNTINGKTIYYLVETANMTLDETSNVGYLRIVACDNITAKNLDMSNLMLIRTTNSTASNITTHDGTNGIHLWESTHNSIVDCTIYNNTGHGVYLQASPENTLTDGAIYNNLGHGVYLLNSPNTELINWIVNTNNYGIYISASANNKLQDNSFSSNTHGFGIEGTAVTDFYQDIEPTNTINGKSIYYIVDDSDKTINETHSFSYLALVACNNITLKNLAVQDLLIILTTNSTLSNITSHNGKDGIYLWDSAYNEITECTVYGNTGYGMYLRNSHYNDITDSTVFSNNNDGVYLTDSTGNNIERCDSYSNQRGFYLYSFSNNNHLTDCTSYSNSYGIQLSGSSENTIEYCDFYQNTYDGLYSLSSSNNNNIISCNAYNNNRYGFYLYQPDSLIVQNCHVYDNTQYGIYGYQLTNSIITGMTIHGSARGIYLYITTTGNTITNCNIHSNTYGIYFYLGTSVNTIMNSDVHGNQYGVYFSGSSCQNNIVVNCSVYNNNEGIYSTSSAKYNKMYHNTLAGNGRNAYSSVTTNIWDNGYPSGGNYWSDYTGVDNDGDGIGDTPYQLGNVKDNYPLMAPKVAPPPVITDVVASPDIQSTTDPVNITCTVIDYAVEVDTVRLHVDGPEGFTLETEMNGNDSSYWNEYIYTTLGIYHYYIWANNTFGRESTSDTYSFIISDVETPVSAVNPLPTWVKTMSFTVTATAFDNTGVANVSLWYRYSSDQEEWTDWTFYAIDEEAPWGWWFIGSSDGFYEFYSIAVDDFGNLEAPKDVADASTGIDTTKPVTTSSFDPPDPDGDNGWYISPVIVTLSADDTLSGVESTWYRIDAGFWKLYTGPFTVSDDGVHVVAFYSFDHAGNKEDTKTVSFKIDTQAPISTHKFEGMMAGGVYISEVTITLTATDGTTKGFLLFERIQQRLGFIVETSGVNYTMYKINDGDWITYVEPFIINDDGDYTIYYYSIDNAGNEEIIREGTFILEKDIIPPVTTHTFSGILGDNNWYVSTVTMTFTATDNAAGVDYTMYKLDDGNWTEYTNPIHVTEDGVHTVMYFSVDKLGNEETPQGPVDFGIDQTAPTITLDVIYEKPGKWLLTATVSDETSGVARVEFYLDDAYQGEATEDPYEWTVMKKGTAQAVVFDNASNSAISDPVPVSVDLKGQSIPGGHTQTMGSTLQRFLFYLR